MAKIHPLRAAVPEELAQWLDAWSVQGEPDCGKPGFPELRAAWIGRRPSEDVIPLIADWVQHQEVLRGSAESSYQMLLRVEPLPDLNDPERDVVLPAWFTKGWSEVLLSRPWDESLADAVSEATAYLLMVSH